jgi:hypothetical protein
MIGVEIRNIRLVETAMGLLELISEAGEFLASGFYIDLELNL